MEITKKEIYVHTDIRTQKSSKNKMLPDRFSRFTDRQTSDKPIYTVL